MSKSPDPATLAETLPPSNPPSNGSPPPNPLALPFGGSASARKVPGRADVSARRGSRPYWIAAGLLVLLAASDAAAHFLAGRSLVARYVFGPRAADRPDVMLYTVKKQPLLVTVTEKGTLESADNRDIVCRVRAGNKGFSTTINWVIEDGTRVKPGQLLMILDDSALKDQEENQNIYVKQALAAKVKAEKDYEIAIKQNESAIALAQTTLALAEIELDKLTGLTPDPTLKGLGAVAGMAATLTEGGAYRQELDDLSGQVSLALAEVEQNRERSDWAQRMVKLTYMSPAQAQSEKSRLDSSLEKLRSLQAKRTLLISHDRRQRLTDLTSKRDNARRAVEQAVLEAEAKEVQADTERQTKKAIFDQEEDKLEDIQRQRKECKIHAPDDIEDGSMVVYFKPESSRFSSNSSQGLIEQGAQVKEGQKMLRIPNLSRMQVNTKVHEAMVSRIKGEVRVPTKIAEFMQFGLLASPDPVGRMVATRPPVVEILRDEFRRFEYKKVADGQAAAIRIDAMAEKKFVGRVRSVSALASQADFYMSDVKLYQTFVRIDGELLPDGKVVPIEGERLKPDMTAEVVISVDATSGDVLAVPTQAVIGGAEMGATRDVYVKTAGGYEKRPVVLGLYNDKMVEIRSGLAEGDEVVTNPSLLLKDEKDAKPKTRDGTPQGGTDGKDSDKAAPPAGGDPNKKKRGAGGAPGGGPPKG